MKVNPHTFARTTESRKAFFFFPESARRTETCVLPVDVMKLIHESLHSPLLAGKIDHITILRTRFFLNTPFSSGLKQNSAFARPLLRSSLPTPRESLFFFLRSLSLPFFFVPPSFYINFLHQCKYIHTCLTVL